MIDVNQLRRGVTFLHDNELYKVTEYAHIKPARGKATIRVDVRNLRSGTNRKITFTSGDRVENVRLDKRTMSYLYDDGMFHVFMDTQTYEQTQVAHVTLKADEAYLKDNLEIELLSYEREVIDYLLPLTIDYEVVDSEMAVAGDTATGATKEVITESGLKVRTPLFVKVGNIIRVNTKEGNYVTRVTS